MRVLGIETSCDETSAAVVHALHVEDQVGGLVLRERRLDLGPRYGGGDASGVDLGGIHEPGSCGEILHTISLRWRLLAGAFKLLDVEPASIFPRARVHCNERPLPRG